MKQESKVSPERRALEGTLAAQNQELREQVCLLQGRDTTPMLVAGGVTFSDLEKACGLKPGAFTRALDALSKKLPDGKYRRVPRLGGSQ